MTAQPAPLSLRVEREFGRLQREEAEEGAQRLTAAEQSPGRLAGIAGRRSKPGRSPGRFNSALRTASGSVSPSSRAPASALSGMARCAGSSTTLSTAKGKPYWAAISAVWPDSMSTAAAPVAFQSARFSKTDVTVASDAKTGI